MRASGAIRGPQRAAAFFFFTTLFFPYQVRACADASVWCHLRSTARSCFFFFLSGSSCIRLALSGCECVTQGGIRCFYFLLLLLLLLLPAEIALRTPAIYYFLFI
jgi:hypothetical protein